MEPAVVPVVIDGRVNLMATNVSNLRWVPGKGGKGWETNPDLRGRSGDCAEKDRPLTWLLRKDPNYRIVYEDKVAVVFVPLK